MNPTFTPTVAIRLALLGVAVGSFGTLAGAGGGFLLAPILLVVYPDESPETITAISLAVVLVNAAAGSVAYGRQRRIDYRSGFAFGIAGIPGAILGAFVVGVVPRRPFDAAFALLLLAVGVWLLLPPGASVQPSTDRQEGKHVNWSTVVERSTAIESVSNKARCSAS